MGLGSGTAQHSAGGLVSDLGKLNLKLGRHSDDWRLDSVPRRLYRSAGAPILHGRDYWTAFEAGYIGCDGAPDLGALRFDYPADTSALIESKSLKLYLQHLSQERFDHREAYLDRLYRDLGECVAGPVAIRWLDLNSALSRRQLRGLCVDTAKPSSWPDAPSGDALEKTDRAGLTTYFSHGFRSRCPVTAQPDWASVWVQWDADAGVSARSLRAYLAAFHEQREFHEACCERIASDLAAVLMPHSLTVACYFLRRGGIDITPVRHLGDALPFEFVATWRQ